jgi:SRSO17 transposase
LQPFLLGCADTQTFDLLGVYGRGLLADWPRQRVEPSARAGGVAVRTLQEFLRDPVGHFDPIRDLLHEQGADELPAQPDDGLGTVGLLDETGTVPKGTKTPGVQRPGCGAVGTKENGVVTVHLGVARGRSKTLVDGDVFLPESWDQDRDRCRAAGIPDTVVYRPQWPSALEQPDRAWAHGSARDGLTFAENYGDQPGFLQGEGARHRADVGEVPQSLRCFTRTPRRAEAGHRADPLVRHSPTFYRQRGRRIRPSRQTVGDQEWEAKAAPVWLSWAGQPTGRTYWLIGARNRRTGQEKYFVSNAPPRTALRTLRRVACARPNVEQALRLGPSALGFRHFEGRSYTGLMRHLVLCLLTRTFVAEPTARLRGEQSGGDSRAGVPGAEPAVRGVAGAAAGDDTVTIHGGGHPLAPAA